MQRLPNSVLRRLCCFKLRQPSLSQQIHENLKNLQTHCSVNAPSVKISQSLFCTMLCILCLPMSQHSCSSLQTANTLRNLSRQVMNIKNRSKLTCKFSTVLQNFIPVHTDISTAQSGAQAVHILAWGGNSFVFDPLQLGEERETAKDCFKLSQTLKRKLMFYFISETWLQHCSSCKAMVNILTTKLLLEVEICEQIPCYSINNPCQY